MDDAGQPAYRHSTWGAQGVLACAWVPSKFDACLGLLDIHMIPKSIPSTYFVIATLFILPLLGRTGRPWLLAAKSRVLQHRRQVPFINRPGEQVRKDPDSQLVYRPFHLPPGNDLVKHLPYSTISTPHIYQAYILSRHYDFQIRDRSQVRAVVYPWHTILLCCSDPRPLQLLLGNSTHPQPRNSNMGSCR